MSGFDSDDEEAPILVEVPSETKKVIPVTILSGFLGSGKTTLLNHILTSTAHKKRIAVIENEFSDGLGIEGMIAKSGVDGDNISNFFELNNGCICCTVKDDLINTLEQLVLHKDRFDYILIETTGMANPGPLISSLWTDSELGSFLQLDGVVCMVDAVNILHNLSLPEVAYEVRQQLCFADRIVINKTDLASKEQLAEVTAVVRELNSFAQVKEACYSQVDLNFVLATESYSLQNGANLMESSFLQCFPCDPQSLRQSAAKPHIDKQVRSISFTLSGKFDLAKLKVALDSLLYNNGLEKENAAKVFRMKAILHIANEEKLFILQSVHELFDLQPSTHSVGSVEDKSNGNNLVVVIGCNLDEAALRHLFESCLVAVL